MTADEAGKIIAGLRLGDKVRHINSPRRGIIIKISASGSFAYVRWESGGIPSWCQLRSLDHDADMLDIVANPK